MDIFNYTNADVKETVQNMVETYIELAQEYDPDMHIDEATIVESVLEQLRCTVEELQGEIEFYVKNFKLVREYKVEFPSK